MLLPGKIKNKTKGIAQDFTIFCPDKSPDFYRQHLLRDGFFLDKFYGKRIGGDFVVGLNNIDLYRMYRILPPFGDVQDRNQGLQNAGPSMDKPAAGSFYLKIGR